MKTTQASGDQDVVNRFFLKYSGTAPTNADLNTFCAAVASAWGTDLAPMFHPNTELVLVTAEDLTSATSAVGEDIAAISGTRAGTVLSAAACMVLSFQIARRYRGGHPRLYFDAGIETDLATRSQWSSTFVGQFEAAWSSFLAAVEAALWAGASSLVGVNVSYFEGFRNFTYPSGRTRPIPTLRVGGPVIDTIILAVAKPNVGSQRRRNSA